MASEPKSAAAFRTIGEVAAATGVAPHILRYWEGRFPQLKPVTRAGKRRYYRPDDVTLVQRIDRLLNREGYTIRGVQQLLAERPSDAPPTGPQAQAAAGAGAAPTPRLDALTAIRDRLADALARD